MLKEERTKKYNDRMRARAQVNHSAGKVPRARNLEPQVRTLSILSVKRVSEPFTKTNSKERKMLKRAQMSNSKVKMTKKQRRKAHALANQTTSN